jgi:hypothetical protein
MKTKMNVAETTKKLIKVRVRVSSWMGQVRSDEGQYELAKNHDAEKDALSVGLALLPKAVQKEIRDHVIGIRKAVAKASLPFEDGGYRILKATEYSRLNAEIQKRQSDFQTYIHDEVYMKYDELRFMAQTRLGSLFDEDSFPTLESIMGRYGACLFVQPIENLEDLRIDGIPDAELAKIKEDTLAEYEKNLVAGQMELVQSIRKAVEAILEKTDNEGSRYKRALENLSELCDSVPALNILGSDELEKLAKQIKKKIATKDSNTIKENKTVKTAVVKASKSMIDELDKIEF